MNFNEALNKKYNWNNFYKTVLTDLKMAESSLKRIVLNKIDQYKKAGEKIDIKVIEEMIEGIIRKSKMYKDYENKFNKYSGYRQSEGLEKAIDEFTKTLAKKLI